MLGIDVVDVERLRALLQRSPHLERRLFTEAERDHCRTTPDPILHLAGTLAAKEAVIKAARLGPLVAWSRRIEIDRDRAGAPSAQVTEDGRSRACQISISHDGGIAVAVALEL